VEYSVAGNIFYGYIGRASGFLWWEIKGGAAWAEKHDQSHNPNNSDEYVQDAPLGEVEIGLSDPVTWNFGDEKHDNVAVTFGIKLWDKFGSNLTLPQFMSEFNSYAGQLQRHAPDTVPVPNSVAQNWPYPVGYFNNKGIPYKPPRP